MAVRRVSTAEALSTAEEREREGHRYSTAQALVSCDVLRSGIAPPAERNAAEPSLVSCEAFVSVRRSGIVCKRAAERSFCKRAAELNRL